MKTAVYQIAQHGNFGFEVEIYERSKKMYGVWARFSDTLEQAEDFARKYFKESGYTHMRVNGSTKKQAI